MVTAGPNTSPFMLCSYIYLGTKLGKFQFDFNPALRARHKLEFLMEKLYLCRKVRCQNSWLQVGALSRILRTSASKITLSCAIMKKWSTRTSAVDGKWLKPFSHPKWGLYWEVFNRFQRDRMLYVTLSGVLGALKCLVDLVPVKVEKLPRLPRCCQSCKV